MSAPDVAESTLQRAEEVSRARTGMGVLQWLTLGSIAASVALFIAGKKQLAIFIGLWPPTLQAMRRR